MEEDKYLFKGLPLRSEAARELIFGLFAGGPPVKRTDIVNKIKYIHEKRGGSLTSETTIVSNVKKVLHNLLELGLADNPIVGYWKINLPYSGYSVDLSNFLDGYDSNSINLSKQAIVPINDVSQNLLDIDENPSLKKGKPVFDEFIYPPYSVLNSREGYWQQRKKAWRSLGIKGELGREGVNLFGDMLARSKGKEDGYYPYASVFDPVLAEILYQWFCPQGGQVVDPFGGESVKGLIAGLLGLKYYGIDLSEEQVRVNQDQKELIVPEADVTWIIGDSTIELDNAPSSDFLFSCPPYGDLEVYSEDSSDLSSVDYTEFLDMYSLVINKSVNKMKDDSFACFVVGDFRDKKTGNYRGFVADTIKLFQSNGVGLYNDMILVDSLGSAFLKVNKVFRSSRKVVKTHQNVLVFVKGNPSFWKR